MDATDLEKIDFDLILHRMEESQAAFEVIEEFFQTGRLSVSGHETLNHISKDDP